MKADQINCSSIDHISSVGFCGQGKHFTYRLSAKISRLTHCFAYCKQKSFHAQTTTTTAAHRRLISTSIVFATSIACTLEHTFSRDARGELCDGSSCVLKTDLKNVDQSGGKRYLFVQTIHELSQAFDWKTFRPSSGMFYESFIRRSTTFEPFINYKLK